VGNPIEVWDRLVKEKCRLGEEMMSLNMGTINRWAEHPTGDVFLNTVPMIERWCGYMRDAGVKPEHEVYDTGMINTCRQIADKKILVDPLHIQFVMVGRTGFLPTMKTLIYSLDQIPQTWTWSVCALGRNEIPMCTAAMIQGGHVRVGFEDNIFIRKGEHAKSNADLVRKMVNIAKELERPIADPSETRRILGLKKA